MKSFIKDYLLTLCILTGICLGGAAGLYCFFMVIGWILSGDEGKQFLGVVCMLLGCSLFITLLMRHEESGNESS